MAKHVQFFRLTGEPSAVYLGLVGEIVVDLSGPGLRVHDNIVPGGYRVLMAAGNLSELTNVLLARSNLGLGTASTLTLAQVLQSANNLSDVASVITTRANLGLGSVALLTAQGGGSFVPTASGAGTNGKVVVWAAGGGLNDSAITGTDITTNSSNLSALANAATARANLGLGTIATLAAMGGGTFVPTSGGAGTNTHLMVWSVAGGVNDSSVVISDVTTNSSNLSGLVNPATARANLGLGSAALAATTAFLNTVLNLSDIPNVATARTNLGLGSAATTSSAAYDAAGAAAAVLATSAQKANNLSDLPSTAIAKANLAIVFFNSVAIAIAAGTAGSTLHGLGQQPTLMSALLINTSADNGYSLNDCIDLSNAGEAGRGCQLWTTSALIGFTVSTGGISAINKGTGTQTALDLTKWKIILHCSAGV